MTKARDHIPVIQRAMGSDPAFADIRFTDYTAEQGSLLVTGSVRTGADLHRLRNLVVDSSPLTAVVFHVLVRDEMPDSRPTLN